MKVTEKRITYFEEEHIKGIELPQCFTFPFFYNPHPLAVIASKQLQRYLETRTTLEHNFWLTEGQESLAIGKMFGVLVVQDADGNLGYLSAFSGKLAGSNDHSMFVPPVFDMLMEDSFFLREQYILNSINDKVKEIEADERYNILKEELQLKNQECEQKLAVAKEELKKNRAERKKLRSVQKSILSAEDYAAFEALMVRHSLHEKHQFNVLSDKWNRILDATRNELAGYENNIESLKKERREKSAALQHQLFEQYVFVNRDKKEKSLHAIFSDTVFGKPPAAAGECATPKLLQYAFINGFAPIAMAEFWWGAPPKSEIRKHRHYYPACTGKCKPILEHMLEGITLDENPLLKNAGEGKELEIIYEDASFIIVNKPNELLSVPGIAVSDSVYTRLKLRFNGIEPLIIHRLDMATSGLLVVAKTKETHKDIQKQFLRRTVVKRYTALVSRALHGQEGEISLPLRGDLDDRPRQMVCFDHGKKAVTKWKAVQVNDTTTKVHFWPLTGRTHQLRMHAAHELGLNGPIVGDDLYGTAANRLHLHAAYLQFTHPVSREIVRFEVTEEF